MSRFVDLVSDSARKMGTSPDQGSTSNSPALIRLDSNENPFGPSPRAIDAMRRCLSESHRYPDDDGSQLRSKVADFHKLPVQQVMITAGSTQMLALLCQTMLGPGLNAVTSQRSFIVYGMAVKAAGAELIEVPMHDDRFDLAAILEAMDGNTRLVFIANPNNPTGTMLDAAAITEFIAEVPEQIVVVLDEAYHEFAAYFAERRRLIYSKSLDYLRHRANVVVLRTFSKAHGLAGLRIGYGLGPGELLRFCARMRSTYSVSSIAQAAALAAMDDHGHIERTLACNADQAQILGLELEELGYRVIPTWANFLYCDLGAAAIPFAKGLRGEGISVRPLGAWGAPQCIRVSLGTPEQNQAFLQAVKKVNLRLLNQ